MKKAEIERLTVCCAVLYSSALTNDKSFLHPEPDAVVQLYIKSERSVYANTLRVTSHFHATFLYADASKLRSKILIESLRISSKGMR